MEAPLWDLRLIERLLFSYRRGEPCNWVQVGFLAREFAVVREQRQALWAEIDELQAMVAAEPPSPLLDGPNAQLERMTTRLAEVDSWIAAVAELLEGSCSVRVAS